MEAGTMHSRASRSISECTFDRIDSPQYLNFDDCIPEAKDSYFERKVEDDPVNQQNSKKLPALPIDFEEDFIEPSKEPDPAVENDRSNVQNLLNDSGDDLIQAVKTLQVDQPLEIKEKEIITSTPFRVKGVQPMQWRPDAKQEPKKYTKLRPFSFEERNKQILQRKAQRIQTLIHAEKEARKFRANPVPKFLKKITSNHNPPPQETSNVVNNKSRTTETAGLGPTRFKAKSPKVLRRPAFKPNLLRQPLLPPQPFALTSELRAKDREIFDNYIKDKERLDERMRELKEAAQKRREEEEIIKMRKEMVIKAQPVRKFKSVSTPVVKRPLTEPMTPIVAKRQRR